MMDDYFKEDLKVVQQMDSIFVASRGIELEALLPKSCKLVGEPTFGVVLLLDQQALFIIQLYDLLEHSDDAISKICIETDVENAIWDHPYLYIKRNSKAFRLNWKESEYSFVKDMTADLLGDNNKNQSPSDGIAFESEQTHKCDFGSLTKDSPEKYLEKHAEVNHNSDFQSPTPCLIDQWWVSLDWKEHQVIDKVSNIKEEVIDPQKIKEITLPINICSLLKVLSD